VDYTKCGQYRLLSNEKEGLQRADGRRQQAAFTYILTDELDQRVIDMAVRQGRKEKNGHSEHKLSQ